MPGQSRRPERVLVKPAPESRLEQLLCVYDLLKSEAEAAAARYDELKRGIQAELELLYPDDERPLKAYDIPGNQMWPALTVSYKEQKYLQAKLIAEHLPEVYETFTKTTGRWELRKKGT